MAYEQFIDKRFSKESRKIIDQANVIIREYVAQGYSLTLRQLYYQFVARDYIENSLASYKRLGSIVNDGRLAGLIDWKAMEDRHRNLITPSSWTSPQDILRAAAQSYKRRAMWENQPTRIEVWVEKEALSGVVERACEEYRLPYFACRGYSSQSEQYAAGKRFAGYIRQDQKVVILHLGDHDPSGIDMTRDNRDRLQMFAQRTSPNLEIKRIALNMDQVEEYQPPPNPAKMTDSRFNGYESEFGDQSWELDALSPTVINDLIRDAVAPLIDDDQWAEDLAVEEDQRERLDEIVANWRD